MINIIYMAAGNSRRFGSNKLFYEIDGKPMYRHVLDRLLEIVAGGSEGTDITVVTQYRQIMDYCNDIRDVHDMYDLHNQYDVHDMHDLRNQYNQHDIHDTHGRHISSHLHAVYSPDSHKGASYTIKAGIRAVQERYEDISGHYFMFVVADQPYLKKESLIKLINAVKAAEGSQAKVFSLCCGSTPGNPCVFHGSLIPELLELEGDQGGRVVLERYDCVYIDIDDPKELCDIDTCDA